MEHLNVFKIKGNKNLFQRLHVKLWEGDIVEDKTLMP